MLLVKSTTPKRINELRLKPTVLGAIFLIFLSAQSGLQSMAQDNSPYTRYGIGDLVPSTNINSRGMGGISAGYNDFFSINFNNPATYSSFQSFKEAKSKKLVSGRAVLDIGMNFENRTLTEPGNPVTFTASNALFSHLQVGVPLRSNWGLSFGLRPVSRVSYKIGTREKLFDPSTGLPIDSAYTEYTGDGGSYLASMGTGYRFIFNNKSSLSIGVNGGYLFGKKEYSTRRTFINDTVDYYRANFESRTVYGNLYFNWGMQYRATLNEKKRKFITFGAHGNLAQDLNGKQDIVRETFFINPNTGNEQLDSVSIQSEVKGKIRYPGSLTVGFVYEKEAQVNEAGWLLGVDFVKQNWDDYRFYGQQDFVASKWELRVGAQLRPIPKRNYLSNVLFRAGFFIGPDYVKVQRELPQFGASFGLGLPIANYRSSYSSLSQATLINLAFEFIKRGNDKNILRENLFRFSVGFSVSDLWFIKRKYD